MDSTKQCPEQWGWTRQEVARTVEVVGRHGREASQPAEQLCPDNQLQGAQRAAPTHTLSPAKHGNSSSTLSPAHLHSRIVQQRLRGRLQQPSSHKGGQPDQQQRQHGQAPAQRGAGRQRRAHAERPHAVVQQREGPASGGVAEEPPAGSREGGWAGNQCGSRGAMARMTRGAEYSCQEPMGRPICRLSGVDTPQAAARLGLASAHHQSTMCPPPTSTSSTPQT